MVDSVQVDKIIVSGICDFAGILDKIEVEMAGAEVGGVDGGLLRADVVRPNGGAGVLGSLGDQAAAGKEIDEGWKG